MGVGDMRGTSAEGGRCLDVVNVQGTSAGTAGRGSGGRTSGGSGRGRCAGASEQVNGQRNSRTGLGADIRWGARRRWAQAQRNLRFGAGGRSAGQCRQGTSVTA